MKRNDFKKVIAKLKKEFVLVEVGTDHIAYDIYKNNILITTVKSSHSPKDYQDNLIAKNLHISKTHLDSYAQCHFSNEELIQSIKHKGYWPDKV